MNNNLRGRIGAAAVLTATVAAAGCSGGGGTSSVITPPAASSHLAAASAKARLTIKLPLRRAAAAKSNKRQPRYVSVDTAGLGIRAGVVGSIDTASWQLFDVSGTSPLCTTSAAVRTCVVQISAPAAAGTSDRFQIDATDEAPASTDTIPMGNLLSSGDVTQAVTIGAANSIATSLTSVIGQLSTDKAAYSVWAAPGQTCNLTVNITANDLDGGQISGDPSSFDNPISFSDNLTVSPFTYPNPSPGFLGLPPPASPGVIPAVIAYAAPAAAAAAPASVTVGTIVPDYLDLPTPPTAVFAVDPLTVSVGGTPVAAIGGLSAAAANAITVTISEQAATQFTVTANNAGASGAIALSGVPASGILPATAGTATFTVTGTAVTGTGAAANAPTISIVDANGTTATITAAVGI